MKLVLFEPDLLPGRYVRIGLRAPQVWLVLAQRYVDESKGVECRISARLRDHFAPVEMWREAFDLWPVGGAA